MKKTVLIINLLTLSLFAKYSLLAPSVPQPLAELNNLVTQRSNQVKSKLNTMENDVIQNIQEEVEKKEYNTQRLRKISKLDYVTNQEYLFLLKKLNQLTNNAIDSQNTTTTAKPIKPNSTKATP